MTTADVNAELQSCHDDAAALAAAAVAPELALAAADEEVGAAVMTACLAQSLAAGHRAMLRMTAAANGVLDFAMAASAVDAAPAGAATKAELSAARLSGSCGRVMEEVRLGLLTLGRLRPEPAVAPWLALGWLAGEISEEEQQRRFAADRAANAPSAVAQERRAAADRAAAKLAAEANVATLCRRDDLVFLRALFGHEMAAGHALTMRLYGAADRAFDRAAAAAGDTAAAERLALAAARMCGRVRRGLLAQTALSTPRNGGGNRAAPAAPANDAPPVAAKHYAEPGQARGKLANGNPSGDYLAAPRCGACTRAGTPCRQPAMRNGRCRFHGGKSTGPKTAAGLARSRAARLTHGGYSAEIIDLQKYARTQARRIREIRVALVGAGLRPAPRAAAPSRAGLRPAPTALPAGHGVDPRDSRRSRGRLAFRTPPAASTTAA